jgi:hypothetical protein
MRKQQSKVLKQKDVGGEDQEEQHNKMIQEETERLVYSETMTPTAAARSSVSSVAAGPPPLHLIDRHCETAQQACVVYSAPNQTAVLTA